MIPTGLNTWDMNHTAMYDTMGARGLNINLDEDPPSWVFDTSLPVTDPSPSGNQSYVQRILADKHYPYSTRPDLRLRDTIKDQNILCHD